MSTVVSVLVCLVWLWLLYIMLFLACIYCCWLFSFHQRLKFTCAWGWFQFLAVIWSK